MTLCRVRPRESPRMGKYWAWAALRTFWAFLPIRLLREYTRRASSASDQPHRSVHVNTRG